MVTLQFRPAYDSAARRFCCLDLRSKYGRSQRSQRSSMWSTVCEQYVKNLASMVANTHLPDRWSAENATALWTSWPVRPVGIEWIHQAFVIWMGSHHDAFPRYDGDEWRFGWGDLGFQGYLQVIWWDLHRDFYGFHHGKVWCEWEDDGDNTLWLFNISMENGPFAGDYSFKTWFIGDFPWLFWINRG